MAGGAIIFGGRKIDTDQPDDGGTARHVKITSRINRQSPGEKAGRRATVANQQHLLTRSPGVLERNEAEASVGIPKAARDIGIARRVHGQGSGTVGDRAAVAGGPTLLAGGPVILDGEESTPAPRLAAHVGIAGRVHYQRFGAIEAVVRTAVTYLPQLLARGPAVLQGHKIALNHISARGPVHRLANHKHVAGRVHGHAPGKVFPKLGLSVAHRPQLLARGPVVLHGGDANAGGIVRLAGYVHVAGRVHGFLPRKVGVVARPVIARHPRFRYRPGGAGQRGRAFDRGRLVHRRPPGGLRLTKTRGQKCPPRNPQNGGKELSHR